MLLIQIYFDAKAKFFHGYLLFVSGQLWGAAAAHWRINMWDQLTFALDWPECTVAMHRIQICAIRQPSHRISKTADWQTSPLVLLLFSYIHQLAMRQRNTKKKQPNWEKQSFTIPLVITNPLNIQSVSLLWFPNSCLHCSKKASLTFWFIWRVLSVQTDPCQALLSLLSLYPLHQTS